MTTTWILSLSLQLLLTAHRLEKRPEEVNRKLETFEFYCKDVIFTMLYGDSIPFNSVNIWRHSILLNWYMSIWIQYFQSKTFQSSFAKFHLEILVLNFHQMSSISLPRWETYPVCHWTSCHWSSYSPPGMKHWIFYLLKIFANPLKNILLISSCKRSR